MTVWKIRPRIPVVVLRTVVGCMSVAWVFVAMNLRSPYLLVVRETVSWLWMVVGVLAAGWLYHRGKHGFPRLRPVHLAACAALLGAIVAGHGRWSHAQNREIVIKTPRERMPDAGRHLVIGWLGFEETRALAAKGGIAGVFLTRISRNTGAGIMLGHVRVMSLDPQHPASCSSAVMRGLLREKWGVTGLLVTDDFSMTPIFHWPGASCLRREQAWRRAWTSSC